MALLTDFFIATDADVQGMDLSLSPASELGGVQAKNTDPVKLVQLCCCADGSGFDQRSSLLDEMLVRDAGPNGPWMFVVPRILSDRLACAAPNEIERIGVAWASTDEWRADGGTVDQIIPFLGGLAKLCAQAKSDRKNLYLWMSL